MISVVISYYSERINDIDTVLYAVKGRGIDNITLHLPWSEFEENRLNFKRFLEKVKNAKLKLNIILSPERGNDILFLGIPKDLMNGEKNKDFFEGPPNIFKIPNFNFLDIRAGYIEFLESLSLVIDGYDFIDFHYGRGLANFHESLSSEILKVFPQAKFIDFTNIAFVDSEYSSLLKSIFEITKFNINSLVKFKDSFFDSLEISNFTDWFTLSDLEKNFLLMFSVLTSKNTIIGEHEFHDIKDSHLRKMLYLNSEIQKLTKIQNAILIKEKFDISIFESMISFTSKIENTNANINTGLVIVSENCDKQIDLEKLIDHTKILLLHKNTAKYNKEFIEFAKTNSKVFQVNINASYEIIYYKNSKIIILDSYESKESLEKFISSIVNLSKINTVSFEKNSSLISMNFQKENLEIIFFLNLSKEKQLLQLFDLFEIDIYAYPRLPEAEKLNTSEIFEYEVNGLGIIGLEVKRNV